MIIIIGNPVVSVKYKNQYVLRGEFMHGDADAYSTADLAVFDENQVHTYEEGLNLVEAWKQAQKISTQLEKGQYGDSWFEVTEGTFLQDEWPQDSTCDDYPASLQEMYIRWYDENGVEYEVNVL